MKNKNAVSSPKSSKNPNAVATLPAGNPVQSQREIVATLDNAVQMAKKPYRRDDGDNAASFRDGYAVSGLRSLAVFAEAANTTPGMMLHRVIRMSENKLIEEVRTERTFEAMEMVLHATEGKQEALGFLKGKLVYCDGSSHKAISLIQSTSTYTRILNGESSTTWHSEAVTKWLRMIAKALPVEGKAAK